MQRIMYTTLSLFLSLGLSLTTAVLAECIACMEVKSQLAPGRCMQWVEKKCMAKQKDIPITLFDDEPGDALCPRCFHERRDHTVHRRPHKYIEGKEIVEIDLGRLAPDGTPLDNAPLTINKKAVTISCETGA